MDTNMALAGSASGRAVLVGAEYGRGVHDTPPGYAGQHCHEKYVWTPVCFTTSPHHGLVQSYQRRFVFDRKRSSRNVDGTDRPSEAIKGSGKYDRNQKRSSTYHQEKYV